jgi:phenylalanyl-tRNA synthetase beta chain
MRVPLNWLGEFVKLPQNKTLLTDRLTMAGHMLDKFEKDKGVIDLELRGNRADCYSITGIAREVSALFKTPVKPSTLYPKLKKVKELPEVKLVIKTPYVKRVMMVEIQKVKIQPSPKWLKERLLLYGIEPINNIVDLTNFVMVETGEPMHAFDQDKVGKNLEIRLAKKGEKVTTFLGSTLTLTADDLVWSKKGTVLSVAGAIGEKFNSISPTTKNVLLEAANYDQANIRRTIHRHNLLTDAGIRHEKELDPNLVEIGIYRFLKLLQQNNWGKINHQIYDYYPLPVKPWQVSLNLQNLQSLAGMKIAPQKIKEVLEGLNLKVVEADKSSLTVLVPTFRTDVRLEEDLVEEVLRIIGYDQIPQNTLALEIPETITPKYISQELELKNSLVSLGFDEIISLPFVKEHSQKYNNSAEPVKIINQPSPDVEVLRTTLFPNLLEITQKKMNERGTEAYFFEIGKAYFKKGKTYEEKRALGLIYWSQLEGGFRKIKGILEALFNKLNLDYVKLQESALPNFVHAFSLILGKELIGFGGQFGGIYYAEVDLDAILDKSKTPKAKLRPKYPPQIEDLTLQLPKKTRVGDLLDEIKKIDNVEDAQLTTVFENAYTFRIWYQALQKTLTNKEVEKIRKAILNKLQTKFGALIKD